jgi:DNA-binding CsgD family transcriptional regulator
MSNSEIAQALFITVKTVEKHLGATFMKLQVRGRNQLPDALRATTLSSNQ